MLIYNFFDILFYNFFFSTYSLHVKGHLVINIFATSKEIIDTKDFF